MPSDDKSLFQVLLSPLFRLTYEDLHGILAHRGKNSLWQSLKSLVKKNTESLFSPIVEELLSLLKRVDYSTPFEFFAYLLNAQKGRQRFLKVFGHGVLEILDEFLRVISHYEAKHSTSLQGFLHWFDHFPGEVKREHSQSYDEVQVRTVHSAKGLQSPIVILPDTVRIPKSQDSLIREEKELLWIPTMEGHIFQTRNSVSKHQVALEQEYRRLLYVAMTRAENHLIVAGWASKKRMEKGCWYHLVEQGMKKIPEAKESQEGSFILLDNCEENSFDFTKDKKPSVFLQPLPPWTNQSLDSQNKEEFLSLDTSETLKTKSLQRGSWIHLLLEHLPKIPATQWEKFARTLIPASVLRGKDFDDLYEEVINIQMLPSGKGLPAPKIQTEGSAGLDLPAAIDSNVVLNPGERTLIPTGFVLGLPKGFEAQLRPRSGLAYKHGITVLNTPGTIDSDYRGEVKVLLINLGAEDFIIERGMRIAQMIIAPVPSVTLKMVSSLDETNRSIEGFGSTGMHAT
ncbi:Deoxyuridine 5'-triphosphate nucleotidohydrolase [Stylophora pistillata]|uniref:dUTP diphosphatase n=1 Tax=Stylophora pistillata TaxID=50429 RepID=A0A2B4RCM4_STYPI|nr:Deoxyuridine 5'-triphosphate nucleotidohydrolase [Stylophora pistillata]